MKKQKKPLKIYFNDFSNYFPSEEGEPEGTYIISITNIRMLSMAILWISFDGNIGADHPHHFIILKTLKTF